VADLADVLNALASVVAGTLYPLGSFDALGDPLPSIAGPVVKVMRGTPFAKQMDEDLRAGIVNLTVNERPGVGRTTTRLPMDWMTSSIQTATLAGVVSENTVVFNGAVTPGQGLILIVDGQPYAFQAGATDTLDSVLSALATAIQTDQPALVSGSVITIPGARTVTVRNVVTGAAIRPTRQQISGLMIKIFAPSFAARDAVGSVVDGALATVPRLVLADGSVAMFRYSGTGYDDRPQKALTFVRTLLYQAEYSTTQSSVQTTIGVVEAVVTPGAPAGPPGQVDIVTDVGPALQPLPSDLNVLIENGDVVVDPFGNPEVQL
jgi:hypothetical protein